MVNVLCVQTAYLSLVIIRKSDLRSWNVLMALDYCHTPEAFRRTICEITEKGRLNYEHECL